MCIMGKDMEHVANGFEGLGGIRHILEASCLLRCVPLRNPFQGSNANSLFSFFFYRKSLEMIQH